MALCAGCPLWLSVGTEGRRASAGRFSTPMSFTLQCLTRRRRRSAIARHEQYKLSPQRRGEPLIGRSTLPADVERECAREGAARRVGASRYQLAAQKQNNGEGSCCRVCQEPATAPSPPVLRGMCRVVPLWLSVRVVPFGSLLAQRVAAPVREDFQPL